MTDTLDRRSYGFPKPSFKIDHRWNPPTLPTYRRKLRVSSVPTPTTPPAAWCTVDSACGAPWVAVGPASEMYVGRGKPFRPTLFRCCEEADPGSATVNAGSDIKQPDRASSSSAHGTRIHPRGRQARASIGKPMPSLQTVPSLILRRDSANRAPPQPPGHPRPPPWVILGHARTSEPAVGTRHLSRENSGFRNVVTDPRA